MSEMIFAGGKLHGRANGLIGHLIFSNSLRKNAITKAMWDSIAPAIDWLANENGVRAIVISGDGGKDFSAGADISEFNDLRKDATTAIAYEQSNANAFRAVREAAVPVIACIRGVCFGGAMGIAAAADLRLADETARFSIPAAKIGLSYPVDAIVDFVATLGPHLTRHALYTGNEISSRTLIDCSFLLAISPQDRLWQDTLDVANAIAANSPMSINASKLAIRALVENNPELTIAARHAALATHDSKDYSEGRQAFQERRNPEFSGT